MTRPPPRSTLLPYTTLSRSEFPDAALVPGLINCHTHLELMHLAGRNPEPGRCMSSDRKSTRLNSSHDQISYAVFCLKKKTRPPSRSTRAAVPRHATPTTRPT